MLYRGGVVDVRGVVRTRRTHKRFGSDRVPREVVEELLELARWAPNHHLTEPWRFRVLGPESLRRLQEAGGPAGGGEVGGAVKLERAPTLVVASCVLTGDATQDEEDLHAVASAVYAVLLAAHARGLAGYWRTPGVLLTPEGRAAVGLADNERLVALIHLGDPVNAPPARERAPVGAYVEFLD